MDMNELENDALLEGDETHRPGDTLVLRTGVENIHFRLVKVDHLTKKQGQIVVDGSGTAFDRFGVPVLLSDRWYQRLLVATPDLLDHIKRVSLIKDIRIWPWEMVATPVIQQVYDLLEATTGKAS
jgi:hypothetical protein